MLTRLLSIMALLLPLSSTLCPTGVCQEPDRKLYVVAVSHLDTQWWWTIQETIEEHIPRTFADTFAQFKKYPDYNYSWEGAFRYMLLEEYYPELFSELLEWVEKGRWAPAGSAIEGGDVNIPSPEALVRQFLYGNRYFEQRLGLRSQDVFLPDCFGFGHALPSAAAHCGLKGFSTQKLGWGSAAGKPFDIGRWVGPDGNHLVAVLDGGNYIGQIGTDLSWDTGFLEHSDVTFPEENQQWGYHYFGIGDQGGPAPEASVAKLQESIESDGPVEVVSAFSDRFFRDLTSQMEAQLPEYKGELLLTQHGTGAYTSQGAMKRWNRKNEQLADAAERAAVAAAWLRASPYPADKLRDCWIRFIAKHFHDDLTGTGIPEIYQFSWNDEVIAQNRLAQTLIRAVGGVASAMDTRVQGIPLVVYNPLAVQREDLAEAVVRFPDDAPEYVALFNPAGEEVPSQVLESGPDYKRVVFLAALPSLGFSVYDVRASQGPCAMDTGLLVTAGGLENSHYVVTIDDNGDIAQVVHKTTGRPLLKEAARLALFDDYSGVWPGWEILLADLEDGPVGHVNSPVEVSVVENGPARVSLQVTRHHGDSTFVQNISLAAGEAGDLVHVENRIDWQSMSTLLKATFPLAVEAEMATYDLGLGTVERGVNTVKKYEVPAQQWVDTTDEDGGFGVAILSDSKYGWDRPAQDTLRLTLLHTPFPFFVSLFYGHHTQDLGPHRMAWALSGHEGDWRNGTVVRALRFNQPLRAFQSAAHPGDSGSTFSLLSVSDPHAVVRAVKKAEDSDEVIVRLTEMSGQTLTNVELAFAEDIVKAREVNGMEDDMGPLELQEGRLLFSMSPYQIRSFALTPADPTTQLPAVASRPVELDLDLDVASTNEDRDDGAFALDKDGVSYSFAAELLPATIDNDGVEYVLGPTGPGHDNALICSGQAVAIAPEDGDRLYILAAASEDTTGVFTVGGLDVELEIQSGTGFVGQWTGRVLDGKRLDDPALFLPRFVKEDNIAWYGTHRHRAGKDDPYRFVYMFEYVLPVPIGAGQVLLPANPAIRIFAMTLVGNPADRIVAASPLHDDFDPLHQPLDWSLMGLEAAQEPVGEDVVSPPPVDVRAGDTFDPATWKQCSGGCGLTAFQSASPTPVPLLVVLVLLLFGIAGHTRRRVFRSDA